MTATLTIEIKITGDLLIATVTGDLAAKDVIAVIEEYYSGGIVKDVVWDFSNGSMKALSKQGFKEIASATVKALANGARQGGRTVFVANRDTEFGLMRMYIAIAEMTGVSVTYTVFRTLAEALRWLK
ncbi:MAG: hypothetical protein PHF56_07470 [Desulfuromonadaceae bacterium]|nr:hypothetical protein [Desulfuromonadaceae bacterium]